MRIALVLWNGNVGGAEVVSATLAHELRSMGVDASLVFVAHAEPLAERLRYLGVPYVSLGLRRGASVLVHPRRLAGEVQSAGPDGALVVDRGYLAAAVRVGGYGHRIVGVEHGELLQLPEMPAPKRIWHRFGRVVGARVRYADVAVSDFMLEELRRHPHPPRTLRIYNAVLRSTESSPDGRQAAERLVVGCAARLIPGKGIDQAIRAVAKLKGTSPISIRLQVAGSGPERGVLQELAGTLGVTKEVRFCGLVSDMPQFWRSCDVAVAAPDTITESFGLAALEAMASSRPVIATRRGALPEIVLDGVCGIIVPPGDPDALAEALVTYASEPSLMAAHAQRGEQRVREHFDAGAMARSYIDLFRE